MSRRPPSLRHRLLRSHLGVAAVGASMFLIALVATTWLRSNNVRLASLRGPTVRATALASNGLHKSAESLYGGIVTGRESFRQSRARAWRDQIHPAVATLHRLARAEADASTTEHLGRLTAVLADLHDWQGWIADIDETGGTPPDRSPGQAADRALAAEVARLANGVAEVVRRDDPFRGRLLTEAAAELEGELRLIVGERVDARPGDGQSPVVLVEPRLAAARLALGAFLNRERGADAERDRMIRNLERSFVTFASMARASRRDRTGERPALAHALLVREAMPATEVANHLLTTLSVKQEELMLADAAQVEWFSNATVVAGLFLFLLLILTAVVQSRRNAERLTSPLAELSEATAKLAAGRFDDELPIRGDDELGRLARSFETMRTALRERREALERSRGQLRRQNRRLRDEVKERRKAEGALARRSHELERANAQLARRNADLDEFSHVASHDLQEPLRKIVSFAKLLRVDLGSVELPERAARDVDFMSKAAQRMQSLVQDLLQLSRAGRSARRMAETPLDACVDAALEHLDVKIAETGAEVRRAELPVAVVDRTMFTQLFQNLIANAIKFQPDGCRPVVEITHDDGPEGSIVGVRDQGIGISPEHADQIFTPFKRLHGREAYEGTGIGLAICRKVVDRHGGRIWVESEPGKGAHFRFTLGEETKVRECPRAA